MSVDYTYLADHIQSIGATYWAPDLFGFDGEGFKVQHYANPDDTSEGTVTTPIAWGQLAAAFLIMADGRYINYRSQWQGLSDYHTTAARDLLRGKQHADEEADADTETWDVALQLAVHGRVIYS